MAAPQSALLWLLIGFGGRDVNFAILGEVMIMEQSNYLGRRLAKLTISGCFQVFKKF